MTNREADIEERMGMILDVKRPPSEAEARRMAEAIVGGESWVRWQAWVKAQIASQSPETGRQAKTVTR